MKVLFATYPQIGLSKGGMRVQIDRTAEALGNLGVEVEYFDPWANQVDGADVCHFFSASISLGGFFARAADRRRKIVWSPVFNIFNRSALRLFLEARIGSRIPGFMAHWKIIRGMASKADVVIALNRQERARILQALPVPGERVRVIPNGVDKVFAEGDPDLFRRKYGIQGQYVLNVAYIGPIKNQLNLIRAMKGSSMSLVLIGMPTPGHEGYLRACKQEAGGNVLFAGTFPYGDPLLLSAYAGAKVFALPSTTEVMTLSLMEAALAGCRLVASSQVPVVDYLRPYVSTPSPHKVREIRDAIDAAAAEAGPSPAREVMLRQPGWEDVGKAVLETYNTCLGRS